MIISDYQIMVLLDYSINYAASLANKDDVTQSDIDYARSITAVVHQIKYQQSKELKQANLKTGDEN